jgi:hypothetical protein
LKWCILSIGVMKESTSTILLSSAAPKADTTKARRRVLLHLRAAKLEALIAAGYNLNDIAGELGISYHAAGAAVSRWRAKRLAGAKEDKMLALERRIERIETALHCHG